MSTARAAESEYRRAFDEFARVVRRVQALVAQQDSDRKTIEIARQELDRARLAYYQARDAWAQHLLDASEEDVEDRTTAIA
jgi:hypothetical protein